MEAITSPIPKQPKPHATATVQTGTEGISTLGAAAIAAATSTIPAVISRSRYGSTRARDCTHDPSAQVPPCGRRGEPGERRRQPRWVTSINGTKDSAATKDPAATPRSRTTEGSPRAAR